MVNFTGDLATTTQGYLNNSTASTPVMVQDSDGLQISNDSASQSVLLQCTATNTLTIAGNIIATQINTDTLGTQTSGNLTLNPTGTRVVIAAGKSISIGGLRAGSLFAFDCLAQSLNNTSESIARYGVADAPNDFFAVTNASGVNTSFVPQFIAHQETSASTASLRLIASILSANDVTGQGSAIFVVGVGGGTGGTTAITNRILYQWRNGSSNRTAQTMMEMLPVGSYADLVFPNALAEKVRISGSTGNISATGQLSVDNIVSTTASTDLTLSATGSNVVVGTGKNFKITGASSGAVPYFNSSAQMVTSVTGTSSQVLIGGTTPAFGSVTSSMVDSSMIIAAGTNAFTGNQSFGNHQATSFRVENVSSNPSAGNLGRLIWNTTVSALEVDNGTSFVAVKNQYNIVSILTTSATSNNTTLGTPVAGQAIPTSQYQTGSIVKVSVSGTMIWASSAFQFTTFAGAAFQPSFTLSSAFSTPQPWKGEMIATIQANGGVVATGEFKFPVATGTWQTQIIDASDGGPLGNLSTGGVTVSWGTASPNNSITVTQLEVVLINGV